MVMAEIDLLLRSAIFALATAGAAIIVLRSNRGATSLAAAFVVAGMGAFVAASAPGIYRALGLAAFALEAWCLATPAFVWLLAMRLFRDGSTSQWLYAVPMALVGFTMPGDYGRFRLGLLADHPALSQSILLAGRAAAMILVLAACALAIAHWRADLVEQRRRLRAAFVAILGTAFVSMAASEFVFGGRGAPLEVLVVAHAALLVVAFGSVMLAGTGGLTSLLIEEPARPPRAPLAVVRSDGPEAELARRVVEAMDARELWKRERLGIGELAEALGVQEYRLRRAINRHLGYRNFNELLHDYRLRAAAARLAGPARDPSPVLTIALDCGYGSIGPFNRAFKARYGLTPTQFRAQSSADFEIGERARYPSR